jgi:hypothetical protein
MVFRVRVERDKEFITSVKVGASEQGYDFGFALPNVLAEFVGNPVGRFYR